MKKIMVISVITLLVILIYAFDIQAYLSVDGLKHSVSQLEMWRVERPLLVGALFFSLYILIALLSLPGAAVMTIGAGALFGLLWGSIIASFASSIGATLAFLLSRYLLRDVVQNRFDKQLTAINAGMAKDGLLYLFALRLVPIFPFFLINLLMGLTTIRTRDYYWVSQLGMLAGTLVYVNAGTQLIRLTSLSEIMSPALLRVRS